MFLLVNLKNKKLKYAETNEVTYKYINSKLKINQKNK